MTKAEMAIDYMIAVFVGVGAATCVVTVAALVYLGLRLVFTGHP